MGAMPNDACFTTFRPSKTLTEPEDDGDIHPPVLILADDPGVPRLLLSAGHRQSSSVISHH